MSDILLKKVRIIDPVSSVDHIGDLLIQDQRIIEPHNIRGMVKEIDGQGMIVAPGFWDVHVHFRDPGHPEAENSTSGSVAAAAGGFTHVVTMPNTNPAGDTPAWVQQQVAGNFAVKILPSACITRQRAGRELADMPALAAAGAVAFTDDGSMVEDDSVMRSAMLMAAQLGKPVMDHAVIPELAKNGIIRESSIARKLGLPVFPPEAEVEAVLRDIRLCEETGCATHIQHISCAGSVAAIRAARAAGLPVTGEASPHHISLTVEDIPGDDGNFRMNPPLGNREDLKAIRAGVLDGTLTMFATDHAPHTAQTKEYGFRKAAFGVIGLETAIGVTWRIMVEEEQMNPAQWVACWTTAPAAFLDKPLPSLKAGSLADLVLIDLNQVWEVDRSSFKSRSHNTPFAGWQLRARPVLTICQGRITHVDAGLKTN